MTTTAIALRVTTNQVGPEPSSESVSFVRAGTSACPDGRFWCSNKGATSKWLHSAAVGDGVCDCCDATDEPPSTGCQHTCREEVQSQIEIVTCEIVQVTYGIWFMFITMPHMTMILTWGKIDSVDSLLRSARGSLHFGILV